MSILRVWEVRRTGERTLNKKIPEVLGLRGKSVPGVGENYSATQRTYPILDLGHSFNLAELP